MISWQKKLEGCFGTADKKFGCHQADIDYAKELKNELDEKGITWAEVEPEIKIILTDFPEEHIEREIKEGKKLLCFGEEKK